MTHLVQTVFFALFELTILAKRITLEEEAHLVAGLFKIAIAELRLLQRGKDVFDLNLIDSID